MRLPVNSGWLARRFGRPAARDEAEVPLVAARRALAAHFSAASSDTSPAARDAERARDAVRDLCDDAHLRHLQPEQLLIAIKEAWRAMPEARMGLPHGEASRSLDRFISLCIAEYYARRD